MSYDSDIVSTATLGDGTYLVEASGEIDASTAPLLQRTLLSAFAEGHERLVLDISPVTYMDSSGIGAVMAAYAEARQRDARFAVVCAENHPAQRIRGMGLEAVLAVFPDRKRALAGVGPG